MGLFLEKMKIIYGNTFDAISTKTTGFEVMFNPESYSETYENHYSSFKGMHNIGGPTRYALSTPGTISMTLVFDATGTNEFGIVHAIKQYFGGGTVDDQIHNFKEATTKQEGNIHEPRCLRLVWGKLDFKCKLTKLSINYKLFTPDGDPLRAHLDVEFTRGDSDKSWKKTLGKKSPDVTHQRTVIAGQSLPMLCKEVYGHERYYLKVAKANRLNDFRNLQPGMTIHFPALKPEDIAE